MKKRKISLQEHQDILYEILYAVNDYCQQHNIKFFLAEGSLIGAVRNQAIIPWDDDVDIWMEREEYERFLSLTKQYPMHGYTVYSIENTPNYYFPFIKVGKNGTCIKEPFPYVPSKGIGINIDIFPLDGCPTEEYDIAYQYTDRKFSEIWHRLHSWTDLRWSSFRGKEKVTYIKYVVPFYLMKWIPIIRKRKFINLYNSCKAYSFNDSFYVGFIVWNFHQSCTYRKEWFSDIVYFPFGERLLPVPIGYHEILKTQYGDYMTPPPVEKRKTTHIQDDMFIWD